MEAMPEKDRLSEVLEGLQERLIGNLSGNRRAVKHPGALGEASEDDWIRVLKQHLPTRYQADRAFVIDSKGSCSEQIDIVIYDHQYSPLLYNQFNQRFIPAESVYCVIEVKQDLNRKHVNYAGQKTESVRKLYRTSAQIAHAGGDYKPRQLPPIIAGLVTFQSKWNPPFGSSLVKVLKEQSTDARLDVGCALKHGVFEVNYLNNNEIDLTISDGELTLVHFLLRLLKLLQPLATAPAIDYQEYLNRIQATTVHG